MRTKNSIKNAKTNMVFNLAILILNFVSRAIFITYLGDTLNGFNSVVTSILGVLNIAEAGVASAVSFSLYKPLAEKDNKKINEIMFIFKRMYEGIGIFIIIAGLMVVPFMGSITKGEIPFVESSGYYILYLLSTATSYFFSYKQTLICADQKEYRIKTIIGTSMITKTILQIFVIIFLKNYVIWILLNLIFNLGNLYIVNRRIDKEYPEVSFKIDKSFKELANSNRGLIKNMKNTFFHKFGEIIITQMDTLLIGGKNGLVDAGYYGNYLMITNGVTILVNSVLQAFSASIGNLIASENNDNSNKIFKQLISFSSYISTVICFGLFMSVNIFINTVFGAGKVFDKAIVFLIVMNLYILINRNFVDSYKAGFGLYWDVFAPVLEGILSIGLGLLLTKVYGIAGVLLGKLISTFIVGVIWKPFVVYKYGFEKSPKEYYTRYILNLVFGLVAASISMIVVNNITNAVSFNNGFIQFIWVGCLSTGFIAIIYLLLSLNNKYFRDFLSRIVNMLKYKLERGYIWKK